MNKGLKFEATLAQSWVASGLKLVREKFTDGAEEKPCDERIDFEDYRIFNELKSTDGHTFNIKQIKPHQMRNLYSWGHKFKNCVSLVSIEFKKFDVAYIINFYSLIDYCKFHKINKIDPDDCEKMEAYKLYAKGDIYLITCNFEKAFLPDIHKQFITFGGRQGGKRGNSTNKRKD